jgi:succinate dehydrogenase/fumarate reductase flavoprotein subunit
MQKDFLDVDEGLLERRKSHCHAILNRKRGFHWKEVEIGVQNLMDFYCGNIRSKAMLKRGIERMEDARTAPFRAENPHELGRCLDVKSIIDNGEMVLRSSLERKESRPIPFGFRRADYPEQDDQNWKFFLAIRKTEDGKFRFEKLPTDG